MKKVALLFPGQGAQKVGMGADFFKAFPIAKHTIEEGEDHLGRHFLRLLQEGPLEELTKTENSQLAIYLNSLAILRVLNQQFPDFEPHFCAGHSLGEYSALTAAKKLDFIEALTLVDHRASFMQKACVKNPGKMAAVLGWDCEKLKAFLLGKFDDCVWIANQNCPGQIVVSGTLKGIESLGEALKEEAGVRCRPLQVNGAFHSPLMEEAEKELAPFIEKASIHTSGVSVVMNAIGKISLDEKIKENLLSQITHGVLWEQGIGQINKEVDYFIEVGGKVLGGMNKRIGVIGTTLAVDQVADLDQLIGVLNG